MYNAYIEKREKKKERKIEIKKKLYCIFFIILVSMYNVV